MMDNEVWTIPEDPCLKLEEEIRVANEKLQILAPYIPTEDGTFMFPNGDILEGCRKRGWDFDLELQNFGADEMVEQMWKSVESGGRFSNERANKMCDVVWCAKALMDELDKVDWEEFGSTLSAMREALKGEGMKRRKR